MDERCEHTQMEMKPTELKNVHIQRCVNCGFEHWHYEDAHG